jgi:hypothetical protein
MTEALVPFQAAIESLAVMICLHFYSVIAHFCPSPPPCSVHRCTVPYSVTPVLVYFWGQGLRLSVYIMLVSEMIQY